MMNVYRYRTSALISPFFIVQYISYFRNKIVLFKIPEPLDNTYFLKYKTLGTK